MSSLITVPAGRTHAVVGKVLLTDVGVQTLHYLEYYWEQIFSDPANDIVPTGELTDNLPVSEFDAQGIVDMAESQMTAHAVALRQLGYAVPEHDVGRDDLRHRPLLAGVAHAAGRRRRDLHRRRARRRTRRRCRTPCAPTNPVTSITIQVGTIARTHARPRRLGPPGIDHVEDHKKVAFLGIGDPAVPGRRHGDAAGLRLPVPGEHQQRRHRGPSAGLAWTLGILNTLGGGNLTGGRTVAATGTIRPDGTIGDVGGVQQKTVAVERRRGHAVLRAPDSELADGPVDGRTARSRCSPCGRCARRCSDLEHLGGTSARAAKGPPAGPDGHSVPTDWQQSPWS